MSVASILTQLIQQAMLESQITSAGGDSPKINRVLYLDINSADFENVIDNEIKLVVEGFIEEIQAAQSGGRTGGGDQGGGTDPMSILSQARSASGDPAGFVLDFFKPYIPVLVPLLAAAAAPLIVQNVIDLLTRPGMPLDPRFKRVIVNEVLGLLDRQQQEDSKIGARDVVVQSRAGFMNMNGAGSNSILKQIREGKGPTPFTSTIGLQEKAGGVK